MAKKKKVFKTDFGGTPRAADPEALFRDLRGRAPEIRHLWSHQADLLRAYHQQFREARDVAVELPTGAGKTLVGLLLGEWRRQAFNQRVAYLCPTRQLARQVGAQAQKYGIRAHVFVGRQRDYPPREFAEFQSSRAIAITTYSGIFNSNPRICDAQTLILDDAHPSENYIASMWSVEIARSMENDLYRSLISLLRGGLPSALVADAETDSTADAPKSGVIDLVPGKYVRELATAICDFLDANLGVETSPWYAWNLIKDHLAACNVFVTSDSILIRPTIPPSLTHTPFSQPTQRIYMSATLGAGGELERITGVNSIQKLPLPAGWDKRGSGRRLFLIPQVAMADEDAIRVVLEAVTQLERTLVLVPTQYEAADFSARLRALGRHVLDASDIEDSIDPFVSAKNSDLVLSRYDGLDLPDDACRLLVMGGLPSGTNLQEKFLWSRIAAFSLLRDRVLTRFTQGVGRCTRSDNDFAVVVVWGRRLMDFILKHENRRILNPELQAELEFGIENCKDKTAEEFKELRDAFLSQSDDWTDAEEAIVALRERSARCHDPVSQRLSTVVRDEVAYLYAMWNGDWEGALQHARQIADVLGGDETKGYRAWWYYLSADAAMALYDATGTAALMNTATDCLKRAAACCIAVSWFARLARSVHVDADEIQADVVTATAVENIRDKLTEWGAVGGRFEQEIGQAFEDIQATEHRAFHRGLKSLGEMLGFRADLPDSVAAPDCVWSVESDLYVVHEAKSDHTPKDPIGVNDVRQAQSHENWLRANRPCDKGTGLLCLMETPRETVSPDAVPHAKSLCRVSPEQMKTLLDRVSSVLRRVRSQVSNLSDEKVLERLLEELQAAELTPREVLKQLSLQPVATMPTAGSTKRRAP